MMRLQKYMARCGVASRRKSEELIEQGCVAVNDELITTPGFKVSEGDRVTVNHQPIYPQGATYILLNKPRGIVSTSSDRHAHHKILDLVKTDRRLYSVGRLDKETEGLLLLTNDGDLTFALTHPSHAFVKTYQCIVEGHLTPKDAESLRQGVHIDTDDGDYVTRPAQVQILKTKRGSSLLEIRITEGKKRQVRKMCEAVGHPVVRLKRTAIGEIRDSKLKSGEWRNLTPEEITYLKGYIHD
jgi:23S rRNA pseudouridine2605 synthase